MIKSFDQKPQNLQFAQPLFVKNIKYYITHNSQLAINYKFSDKKYSFFLVFDVDNGGNI